VSVDSHFLELDDGDDDDDDKDDASNGPLSLSMLGAAKVVITKISL
jgi:hypothetical protein